MLKRFCDMKGCPREGLSYRIGSREFDLCPEHIKQIEEWAAENLEGGRLPEERSNKHVEGSPVVFPTYPALQVSPTPTFYPPNSQPGLTGAYPTVTGITWVSGNVQGTLPAEGVQFSGLASPLPDGYIVSSGVFYGDSNWTATLHHGSPVGSGG